MGKVGDHPVADGVVIGIIDFFEAVDVRHDDADMFPAVIQLLHHFVHMGAVEGAGQKVTVGHLLELVPFKFMPGALRFGIKGDADDVVQQEEGDQHFPFSHLQQAQEQGIGQGHLTEIQQISAVQQQVHGLFAGGNVTGQGTGNHQETG
ncbi:hypothetical protein D3C73_1308020 [compost metagenome]